VTQIATGNDHSVALKNDGTVVAWGSNFSSQCNLPGGLSGVTQIAAGSNYTIALVNFTDCDADGQRDSYELGGGLATDCDGNGVPDSCDIDTGAADANANDRIDACEHAQGDMDLSGEIDFGDVALVLLDYGPCAGCITDLDGSGEVDFGDVALVLLNFGSTG
jgi:alpha-tubulin suppressor-like RCC1 family protein